MTTIDLHGVKHEDVRVLLDRFLWENMVFGNSSVDIITGKSDKMKNIVSDIVAEYGYVAKESLINNGVMTVYLV